MVHTINSEGNHGRYGPVFFHFIFCNVSLPSWVVLKRCCNFFCLTELMTALTKLKPEETLWLNMNPATEQTPWLNWKPAGDGVDPCMDQTEPDDGAEPGDEADAVGLCMQTSTVACKPCELPNPSVMFSFFLPLHARTEASSFFFQRMLTKFGCVGPVNIKRRRHYTPCIKRTISMPCV